MLQKIIGILGVLVVAGVIAMVALSPRAPGFCPDLFDFTGLSKGAASQQMETKVIMVPDRPDEVIITE